MAVRAGAKTQHKQRALPKDPNQDKNSSPKGECQFEMMYSNRLRFRIEGEGGPEGKAAEVHHLCHRPRDAAERPPQRFRRLGAVPQQGVGRPVLPMLRRGRAPHVRLQDVPEGKLIGVQVKIIRGIYLLVFFVLNGKYQ